MYRLARELFPICRSLTGQGVRDTLAILQRELPGLEIRSIPSGTQCFDWQVPNEWNITEAYLVDPNGKRIVDFATNNLHVVGYSTPVDRVLSLPELQPHLHSLPSQPDAIPYVTSYYRENWGFCLSHQARERLAEGNYRAVIRSELKPGVLNYAELILPGSQSDEVFLSTYVCHPSMGNNELSGPVVATFLGKWLHSQTNRRLTYRLIFIPETIGSIVYLSRHLEHLKRHVVAGFNLTCIGDDKAYSFLPSRSGNSLADRVARHVLKHHAPGFKSYSFLDRGSDERQYCSPGVDLPVATIMRSKYHEYAEYHTSLDDLSFISPAGLGGGFEALRRCLMCLENNATYKMNVLCEPQLGKRGLYPDTSVKGSANEVNAMMDLIAYTDGREDLLTTAETIGQPLWELVPIAEKLINTSLMTRLD